MSGILDLSDPGSGDAGADVISGVINVLNAKLATGTPTPGSFVAINVADADTLGIQVTGTFVATLVVYGSLDNTNRVPMTNLVNVNGGGAVTNMTGAGIYQVDVAALSYIYVFASAYTSGAANVTLSPTDNTGVVAIDGGSVSISGTSSITPGVSAANLGKAEDAVAASGDTGIANLGVRVPATPAAQTSAAGDYGMLAVDAEGKLIASQYSATDHYWQSTALTLSTTTSTAVKAAAAAGVRNYLTDIDIANTSATGVRVDVLDGATVIASFWSPPTSHVQHSYSIPKKGTAATAMNVQLSAAVTDVRVSANGYIGI